jgi:Domain of unknown function (DUF4410)
MKHVHILCLLALAPLVSCAGASMVVREPIRFSLEQYPRATLEVDSRVATDVAEELKLLKAYLVTELQRGKAVELVEGGAEAGDGCLRVHATVTHINKVSSSARLWGGALAGKASLTVDLAFSDGANGGTLGSVEVTGKSGSTGMAGGTNSAVRETAKKIADLVLGQRGAKNQSGG